MNGLTALNLYFDFMLYFYMYYSIKDISLGKSLLEWSASKGSG